MDAVGLSTLYVTSVGQSLALFVHYAHPKLKKDVFLLDKRTVTYLADHIIQYTAKHFVMDHMFKVHIIVTDQMFQFMSHIIDHGQETHIR